MGLRENMAKKFIENTRISEKLYITANNTKRVDERLRDLAHMIGYVKENTEEQSTVFESSTKILEELSESIKGVVSNAEELTNLAEQANSRLGKISNNINKVASNSENTSSSIEEISASIE
jgi:methyl-accepting chemotaxis protein